MTQTVVEPVHAHSPSHTHAHTHAHGHTHEAISPALKAINLVMVVLPFLGLIAAMTVLWGSHFNWLFLGIMLGMYLMVAFGITMGYHRLFTHRSFEAGPVVTGILGVLGSMAVEGPILWWVAMHRRHHQHADQENDPHSPHLHGEGFMGMMKGLWHSHVGWLFAPQPTDLRRYVGDLRRDKVVRTISRYFPALVLLGLAIPAIAGGLLTMSWHGALLGFVWGGLVRTFFVHHVTWSINSVCHFWGSRPFAGDDESRNNPIFGLLGMGEGWHNNHHAFPTSARHGLWWWQIDFTYLMIRLMEICGLVRKVKVPTREAIEAKRARMAAGQTVTVD
ncbi:MAG TPA: fatty acid desaturase [Tepidisphaeraceae bacterium]|jgi:stearoyl-CoA desaturase (delta-9 desaturase)|nr:fatty acid desaturase [Tepidisphaeraceae bacterium]